MDKKRRLSSGWSLKNGGNEDLFFEPNDDEAERRQSRVHIPDTGASSSKSKPTIEPITKKKKPNDIKEEESAIPPSAASKRTDKLSNDQIVELYSNCIKLCTENKINTKNAWQLNFIDYMDDMLETQKEEGGDNTNFQAASHTLDASVKIWSCRVDAIHTDTFKILGGLSRTEKRDDEAAEDDEGKEGAGEKEDGNEQEKGEAVEKKKKAKKVPVGGVHTLETHLENINAKKVDLEFMVDPLFRKTSEAFDEGGARGLLLNHLRVFRSCELIFDSADAVDGPASDSKDDDTLINISELRNMLKATGGLEDLEVCPTFSSFSFEKTGPGLDFTTPDDSEDERVELESEGESGNDNHDFPAYEEVELDEGGIDQQAVAMSFAHSNADKEQAVPDVVGHIADEAWSDFQYFNPKIAKSWAGPEHWRFTSVAKAPANKEDGGETEKKKKGTKRKGETFYVDFFGPPPDESLFAPPGRALTTLSAAALKKANEASTTLPPDIHYDIKMLTQLFSKPKWVIPPLSKRRKWNAGEQPAKDKTDEESAGEDGHTEDATEGGAEGGGDWFNFENAEAGANSDDEDAGVAHEHDEENTQPQFGVGSQGFVNEPQRVQKVNINYAKVAKKVDVKALKSSIWSELCGTPATAKKVTEEKFTGTKQFTDLLSGVSERTQSNPELRDTSVAMNFICLLHLANEKGLSLVQNGIDTLTINSGDR